jgi:thiamine biosynthesis lipoprotein
VRLLAPRMRLDLGGIAKGYALDQALDVLAAAGVGRALVDGGGDVAASGAPRASDGWRVALWGGVGAPDRREAVALERAALATSGDAFQALEIGSERRSHVLDPRTGEAQAGRASASVWARDGATADALATALCVLEPAEGLALAARFGAEARVERGGPAGIETVETPGFRTLVRRIDP